MGAQQSAKKEIRKIQMTGGSTYIISLPKKWVLKSNLKKGSPVTLMVQNDGTLCIVPESEKKTIEPAEAIIYASDNETSTVIRKLISVYLAGYDTIIIKSKKTTLLPSQKRMIKSFVKRMLVGTEIIGETQNEIMLKVLLSYPTLVARSVLRRMSLIASSMHKTAITALRIINKDLAQDVIAMDDDVDRFNLYIIRQLRAAALNETVLREIGLSSIVECFEYRIVSKTIERVADHATKISERILTMTTPLKKEIYEQIKTMSTLAISAFEESIEALFRKDFTRANEIIDNVNQVIALEDKITSMFLRERGVGDISNHRIILESIRRTAEYARDIAEIVLDITIDETLKRNRKRQ